MSNHTEKSLSNTIFDVAGIGNAIVDILMPCEDADLEKHRLDKGTMTLVDGKRAGELYNAGGSSRECSGGSVANTLAGMASLGAKCAFIGKLSDDQFGSVFLRDMHAVGVHFSTPPANGGPATAICLVFVTPDAQRTMATHIGACSLLSANDIDDSIIEHAKVTYIEGYLWDTENAKAAIRKAMRLAHTHDRKIAFTLSDVFCVDRHRAEFLEMIDNDIDILFANEKELLSLYQTDDMDKALGLLKGKCEVAAVTRSEKGSIVLTQKSLDVAAGEKVQKVIDTTGAGDLYAAGFLYGYTRGWDMKACAKLGNQCAAEIITQFGARSLRPLKSLVA